MTAAITRDLEYIELSADPDYCQIEPMRSIVCVSAEYAMNQIDLIVDYAWIVLRTADVELVKGSTTHDSMCLMSIPCWSALNIWYKKKMAPYRPRK
jgi:hypothetical protein